MLLSGFWSEIRKTRKDFKEMVLDNHSLMYTTQMITFCPFEITVTVVQLLPRMLTIFPSCLTSEIGKECRYFLTLHECVE